jgi:hypothetical protein
MLFLLIQLTNHIYNSKKPVKMQLKTAPQLPQVKLNALDPQDSGAVS